MSRKVKGVGYVRMSSDKQDASPAQQRNEITKFAEANGYKITNWYEDLGISGDRTDKRVSFQRMIADGSTGEFEAILCWNQDRFGRFDSIEAGRWIFPLREAGVHLATVTDGVIDWHSMAGRITYGVAQEGKHQYLSDLSKNVRRGMEQLAQSGKWLTGVPPFGYVVDEDQRLQLGEQEDVAIVQEVYQRYLSGESLRQISTWLGDRGIVSPKGKPWTASGISSMLKNERYLGYMIYNQRTCSKYEPGNPKGKVKQNPRKDWLIVENTHPAIVTREQFDAAQELMKGNTRKTLPNPENPTALSGLLRCGCCGYGMHADRSNGVPQYTCYSYRQVPGSCERYAVREKDTLKLILSKLRTEFFDVYLTGENLKRVMTRMREILNGGDRPDVKITRQQLQKVDGKLEQARRRLVEVSPDMIQHVESRIRELEDQRDKLLPLLKESEKKPADQITAAEKRISAAVEWLERLEAIVDTNYDQKAVNGFLKAFVDHVDLDIVREQWGPTGKRFKCRIVGGRVFLKTQGLSLPLMLMDESGDLSATGVHSVQVSGPLLEISFKLAT